MSAPGEAGSVKGRLLIPEGVTPFPGEDQGGRENWECLDPGDLSPIGCVGEKDVKHMSKHVLITGSGGSLAPHVIRRFTQAGWEWSGWDRKGADPDDTDACIRYFKEKKPDALIHLGMGHENWSGLLARLASERGIPFAFTSSVMVFGNHMTGPFQPGRVPEPADEYGAYKLRCEEAVTRENPRGLIIRLGWQFDENSGGNNMFAQLSAQAREQGYISASKKWIPACSHMAESGEWMYSLLSRGEGGVYHLDGNSSEAWNFYDMIDAIRVRLNLPWELREDNSFVFDQRMLDDRCEPESIPQRLGISAADQNLKP